MKSEQAPRKRRAYDNRLRQEQGKMTRERILEAATALFAESETSEFTIAAVAERARVAEPTIYRHFGNREQLYEAIDQHLRAHIGMPSTVASLEQMPAAVQELFQQFDRHAQLLRAALRTGLAREIRKTGKRTRDKEARALLARHASHLGAAEVGAVAALYRVLMGWESWDRLTGEMEIESKVAADAVAWAIEALNEKLERDRIAERKTLRPDEETRR